MIVTDEKPLQNLKNSRGNSVSVTIALAGMVLFGCQVCISSEVVSDIATTNSLIIKNWGVHIYNINI